MHARVVRFTGVDSDQIRKIVAQVEESEGPPPGVEASAFKLFFDESQGTSVFIAFFETEEKMRAANEIFEQMDPGETPGSRASVDLCEVMAEGEM
jgi:hypothetical protein